MTTEVNCGTSEFVREKLRDDQILIMTTFSYA